MGRMYYPKVSKTIVASKPHPIGTEYYVSIGEEDWDGEFQTVVKVQMMYNGKIAGRKSPSYPVGTDDSSKVAEAIVELEKEYIESGKRVVVYYPAKKATYVPASEFIELIMRIPEGKVGRWEDIVAYLKRIHQAEAIDVDAVNNQWSLYYNDVKVPYWRMVGTYGYLSYDSHYGNIEDQKNLLTYEGLEIEPCGQRDKNGKEKSLRVKNYKKLLFDFSIVPPEEVLNTKVNSQRHNGWTIEQLEEIRNRSK